MIVPLVSVCCLTYNHAPYIRECLDGFLMQNTTFPIEVLIHDDASTDNTAAIIREYEAKYPDIIKPIYQVENQYSKGVKVGAKYNYSRAIGKYIAMCEGDDYWTDPLKLQKQVDFLEANQEYAGCFTATYLKHEHGDILFEDRRECAEYTTVDILKNNPVLTLTMIFRGSGVLDTIPDWFSQSPYGDWPLWILVSRAGKIKYLDECTAVYNKHQSGVFSGSSKLIQARNMLSIRKIYYRQIKQYRDIQLHYLLKQYRYISSIYIDHNMHKEWLSLILDIICTVGIRGVINKKFTKIILRIKR